MTGLRLARMFRAAAGAVDLGGPFKMREAHCSGPPPMQVALRQSVDRSIGDDALLDGGMKNKNALGTFMKSGSIRLPKAWDECLGGKSVSPRRILKRPWVIPYRDLRTSLETTKLAEINRLSGIWECIHRHRDSPVVRSPCFAAARRRLRPLRQPGRGATVWRRSWTSPHG